MVADGTTVALAYGGGARVLHVEVAGVVAEVVRRHGLKGRAARLAAELVAANALLGAFVKGEERLQLQVRAEDPECSYFGELDARGWMRASFAPAIVPGEGDEVTGVMLAIKSDAEREMYRGLTPLEGGTVAVSLERHLRTSAQVRAGARIVVSDDLSRVMGLLAERLPDGAGGEDLPPQAFEARWAFAALVEEDTLLDDVANARVGDDVWEVLERRPLRFQCRCTRDRVTEMLISLGPDELREMADEDHGAEVVCHFCNDVQRFSEDELRGLANRIGVA